MADIITKLINVAKSGAIAALAAQTPQSGRIMWKLGKFIFSRDTAAPQSLNRSTAYAWSPQDRFGRDPALQFTGAGADTITLGGVIYPHYGAGFDQINAMRDLAGRGEPQLLVDGRGTVYGKWSILRIEETNTVFMDNGTPRKMEFSMELQRYGDDVSAKKKLGSVNW